MHETRKRLLLGFGILGFLVGGSCAAYDDGALSYPLKNLCRRWDHQSVAVNNKLYLLGGRVLVKENIGNQTTKFEGEPSREFLELDLSQKFSLLKDGKGNNLPPWKATGYSINEPKDSLAVAGGGMWANNNRLYVYDGQHTKSATAEDKSTLWSYDITTMHWNLEESWDQGDKMLPNRFSRGTGVNVPEIGMGFYVGGARIYGSKDGQSQWNYPVDQQFIGMDIGELNYEKNFKTLAKGRKTIGAAVTWVPVGDKGSLIMIQGTDEQKDDRAQSSINGIITPDTSPAISKMSRKEEVWIYDIASNQWHIQVSSGKIPSERMHACAVAVSAPDKSSHQIFYYGGSSGSRMSGMDDSVYFGDLYVLNLPSFEWMQFSELANVPAARTRHTCHVVNNRQLLVLGGSRNDTGTVNEKSCVWDEISVLDMTKLQWETQYTPATEAYKVNDEILTNSKYMGNAKTAPSLGWANDDLRELFFGKEHTILGLPDLIFIGVVGGVSLVIFLLSVLCVWYRRRRKRQREQKEQLSPPQAQRPFSHLNASSFDVHPKTPAPQYPQHSPYFPGESGGPFYGLTSPEYSEKPPHVMATNQPPAELSGEPKTPTEMPAAPVIRHELSTIPGSPMVGSRYSEKSVRPMTTNFACPPRPPRQSHRFSTKTLPDLPTEASRPGDPWPVKI